MGSSKSVLCGLALAILLQGCETVATASPVGLHLAVVKETRPVRAWHVVHDGEPVGAVVQYEDPLEPESPVGRYYSVRNLWQQELGAIDAHGRAWRFVPHQDDARWVGTGTLLEGARAILAAGHAAQLVEVPVEALVSAGGSAE